MVTSKEIKFVPKGWGFEKWIVNCEEYCGKLLYIIKGKKCSWHFHKLKDEVFYVQSGDPDWNGETKFSSPITYNYTDLGTSAINEEVASVIPEDGKLVIFPSYLKHYQSLYTGNQDRIVVAFNSSIIDKIPS